MRRDPVQRRTNHAGHWWACATAVCLVVLPCAPAVAADKVPTYRWKPVTLKAPFAARDGAGALVYKGRMWLLGGWNPGDKVHFPRICNNEVWSSRDGLDWKLDKPNTFLDKTFDTTRDWEGRHTAGYVVYRNKMWIVGGDVNQGHYQNDVAGEVLPGLLEHDRRGPLDAGQSPEAGLVAPWHDRWQRGLQGSRLGAGRRHLRHPHDENAKISR